MPLRASTSRTSRRHRPPGREDRGRRQGRHARARAGGEDRGRGRGRHAGTRAAVESSHGLRRCSARRARVLRPVQRQPSWPAGRIASPPAKEIRKIVLKSVEAYRTAMREFAKQSLLAVWYAHLDVQDAMATFKSQVKAGRFKAGEASLGKAYTKETALRRSPSSPPSSTGDAGSSASPGFAGKSEYDNQGERVVAGQHLMQATSDIFLGWQRTTGPDGIDRDYYVRQLRDWRFSVPLEQLLPVGMGLYAGLCGWTLARAHARALFERPLHGAHGLAACRSGPSCESPAASPARAARRTRPARSLRLFPGAHGPLRPIPDTSMCGDPEPAGT